MNASDYGGGTPIVDVWRRDVRVAVGHVEPRPRLVSAAGVDAGCQSCQDRCELSTREHAGSGRESRYIPYFRGRPPGRLLPHLGRLPAVHDEEARLPDSHAAIRRVRSNLVRVGLRANDAAGNSCSTRCRQSSAWDSSGSHSTMDGRTMSAIGLSIPRNSLAAMRT